MHVSTRARRALDQINIFLARRDYPETKKISFECTKKSLRYHPSQLLALLSKGVRKENYRGSHYMQCTQFNGGCPCESDNARILEHVSDVNRLLRGM
jgi:hypothetical protein